MLYFRPHYHPAGKYAFAFIVIVPAEVSTVTPPPPSMVMSPVSPLTESTAPPPPVPPASVKSKFPVNGLNRQGMSRPHCGNEFRFCRACIGQGDDCNSVATQFKVVNFSRRSRVGNVHPVILFRCEASGKSHANRCAVAGLCKLGKFPVVYRRRKGHVSP